MNISIGKKIRDLRKNKGLTLEELANLTGTSKSYIWKLENKTPQNPSSYKLKIISEILGVPVGYLLGDKQSNKENAQDVVFFEKFRALDSKSKLVLQQTMEILENAAR